MRRSGAKGWQDAHDEIIAEYSGIKYVEQVWGSAVHHYFQQRHLEEGTELFSMGSPSEHLYFVRSGE